MFLKYKFLVNEKNDEIIIDIISTTDSIFTPTHNICDCNCVYPKPISVSAEEGTFIVPISKKYNIGNKTYKKPDKESLLNVIASDLSISTDMDLYHTISSVINKYVSTNNGYTIKCSIIGNDDKEQAIVTPESIEHQYNVNYKSHLMNMTKSIISDSINLDLCRIKEVTAENYMSGWGPQLITLEDIITPAITLLPEIGETNLVRDKGYQMIDLCSKILFTILPEAKRIKRGDIDGTWSIHIATTTGDYKGSIFVSSYITENAPYGPPRFENNGFHLTVKQAGVLAIYILEKLNKLIDIPKLTPRAESVFCIIDLQDMLRIYNKTNNSQDIKNTNDFANMLNSSCEPDGALLANSNATMACIAVLANTKYMKSLTHRTNLFIKTYQSYARSYKYPCIELFNSLWPYATGGVAFEFTLEKMMERISKLKPLGSMKT